MRARLSTCMNMKSRKYCATYRAKNGGMNALTCTCPMGVKKVRKVRMRTLGTGGEMYVEGVQPLHILVNTVRCVFLQIPVTNVACDSLRGRVRLEGGWRASAMGS